MLIITVMHSSNTNTRLFEMAYTQGISCTITSAMETGIGTTASLQLASVLPDLRLSCGLATLDLLETSLLEHNPPIKAGELHLPEKPGLGVSLYWSELQRFAAERSELPWKGIYE